MNAMQLVLARWIVCNIVYHHISNQIYVVVATSVELGVAAPRRQERSW